MSRAKPNRDPYSFELDGTEDGGGNDWTDELSGTHGDNERPDIGEVCSNGRPIRPACGSDGPGFEDNPWGPPADRAFERR